MEWICMLIAFMWFINYYKMIFDMDFMHNAVLTENDCYNMQLYYLVIINSVWQACFIWIIITHHNTNNHVIIIIIIIIINVQDLKRVLS